MAFRWIVVGHRHDREAAGKRAVDVDEPSGIELFENEVVFGGVGAEPVTEYLIGAMILVDVNVIERARIRAPNDMAVAVDDLVGEIAAAREITHADSEKLGAARVGAPRQQSVIGRMFRAADVQEGLPLPERVAIEEDLLGRATARPAADDRMLPAFAIARVIIESA